MRVELTIGKATSNPFLGTRFSGAPLRKELENLLKDHRRVQVDFAGYSVTQSFVDEVLGVLVLHRGPSLIKRLLFKGCTPATKSILKLVISRRLSDYQRAHQH